MWFKVMLLALSLFQLGLGAAQECEGFSGVLGMTLENVLDVAIEKLNSTLEKVVDVAIEKLNSTVEKVVDVTIEQRLTTVLEVIANVSSSMEQLVTQMDQSNANIQAIKILLHHLRVPGSTPSHPAVSCKEIKELNSTAPSGYYWLRGTGDSSVHMYCDMSRSCGGITGGWMRVTRLNMTNSNHTCPAGLKLLTTPKRLCTRNIDGGGCSSATFSLHGMQYTHVCGKIIGYQYKSLNAFHSFYHNRRLTIDNTYVDGVSLTHGRNPRKHIWTFAGAIHEVTTIHRDSLCPCTNIHNPLFIPIPSYVGSDYFCDTASKTRFHNYFFPDDPLWDGQGCGRMNTCCSFNNPPWFMKELPSSTSDDIEMRLCASGPRSNDEDIPVEIVELYVQ